MKGFTRQFEIGKHQVALPQPRSNTFKFVVSVTHEKGGRSHD